MAHETKQARGFTLLEVMIVAAIVAVTASVSLAFFGSRPARVYTDTAAKQFYTMLQDARGEAIRSSRNVIVQANGLRYISVWRDESGDGTVNESREFMRGELKLTGEVLMSEEFTSVFYNHRGYLTELNGSPANRTVIFCVADPNDGNRCLAEGRTATIEISALGLPSLQYGVFSE